MAKPAPKKLTHDDTFTGKTFIPEKYQDVVYMLLLVIAVFVFLAAAISKGGFNEFDNVASLSFSPYIDKATHDGAFPLWMPYIFGGMPSYPALLVTGSRVWDLGPEIFYGISGFFTKIFNNDAARVAIYYALYGIGIYLLMRFKKHERFVSFLSGFAAMFSTWVITWIMIGHNTKPVVLCTFPFIFFLLEKLRVKFSLMYAALLIFIVHIMFEGGHLQMIFYGACAFGIYLLYELISRAITKNEPLKVLRSAVFLIIAFGFAYLMSADRYMAVQEYTPYSTRGSAPILKTDKQRQDDKGGNDYDYATMWSYSPSEMFTIFNPSYFGFGKRDLQLDKSSDAPSDKESTYWGQKESEDSPPYMGIGVLALAILGFIIFRKDPFVQFLLVLSIFSVLLSMGKNMPVLYNIFYNNFPSFNKFRAPSMALVLFQFAVPVLSGYGIAGIIKFRKEITPHSKKIMLGFVIAAGAFLVLGFLFTAAFKSSYLSSVANSRYFEMISKQSGQAISDQLQAFVWDKMVEDWYFGGFILLATALLCYFYAMGKVKRLILFSGLIILLVVDLWRVDYRRMQVSEESVQTGVFEKKADVFNKIKTDKSVFRIADFSSNPANIPAYFLLENINGYHAAKMRIFQDLMDVANSDQFQGHTSELFNPFLWNLMNVKYIITNRPFGQQFRPIYQSQVSGDYVYPNPGYMPRAFFIKHAVIAKQIAILNHLKEGDFTPTDTAFIEKDLPSAIEPADSTAKAEVLEMKNEWVKLEAVSTGNNLLFISQIYYPIGWKATIDGNETPIIKTNYAFSGIIVPKGKHSIELKFTSAGFEKGKMISMLSNLVAALALAGGIFMEWRRKKKEVPKEVETVES